MNEEELNEIYFCQGYTQGIDDFVYELSQKITQALLDPPELHQGETWLNGLCMVLRYIDEILVEGKDDD